MKKNPRQWTIIASVTINAEVSIVSAVIGEREMIHTPLYKKIDSFFSDDLLEKISHIDGLVIDNNHH